MPKELICKDCRNPFVLTDGEIKFYERKQLYEPRRCPECREKRKKENKEDA